MSEEIKQLKMYCNMYPCCDESCEGEEIDLSTQHGVYDGNGVLSECSICDQPILDCQQEYKCPHGCGTHQHCCENWGCGTIEHRDVEWLYGGRDIE